MGDAQKLVIRLLLGLSCDDCVTVTLKLKVRVRH